MGKLTGLCVLLLVLNVALTENTVTPVYFTDGGDLVLKVRPAFPAKLIKKVQKPKVVLRSLTCGALSHSCRFSCDSDTTEAEPVSYSWKKGDGEWEVSGKDITITREYDSGGKTFTCRMENPVSREESDPLYKKLFSYYTVVALNALIGVGTVVVAVVGLVVVGLVVVGLFVALEKKIFPFNKGCINIPDPAHGNGQPTSPPSDSSPKTAETVPLQANPQDTKSEAKETA